MAFIRTSLIGRGIVSVLVQILSERFMIFDTVAKLRSHLKTEHQVNGGGSKFSWSYHLQCTNATERKETQKHRRIYTYPHKRRRISRIAHLYFEGSSCFYNCASVDDFEAHVLNSRLSQESPKKMRRRSSTSNLFPRPLELVSNHCILQKPLKEETLGPVWTTHLKEL